MDDPLVNGRHPLSLVVLSALRDGRAHREDISRMMARAAHAVLAVQPAMSLTEAYGLVNELWVR